VTSARADEPGRAFEAFTVGGSPSPLFDPAVLSQRVALHAVPAGVAAGDRIQVLRLSARLTGFTTYATFAGAGKGRIDRYHRVYGLEDDLRFPGIGFARLPETHVRFGAGYSLDAPFAHRLRPYVSVTYRP
jgi:hypothetical protein